MTEIGLKVNAASGRFDFWGGALRIPHSSTLTLDKAELRLNDGRSGRVVVDFLYDDEDGRVVTFFGYSALEDGRVPSFPAYAAPRIEAT